MPKALQNVSGWMWRHRLKIIALVLVLSILAPKPAPAQIFTPVVAIIVSALTSINQALTSVIGGALDIMNQTPRCHPRPLSGGTGSLPEGGLSTSPD